MSINDQVSQLLKEAMRNKDAGRLRALRGIRAAFIAAMKEDGSDTLSDDACLPLLRRLAKQRKESITAFKKGGRDELAADEQAELDVIEAFLPKMADEAMTQKWVEEAIEATGASSKADMGRVMGHLMKNHRGEMDGKLANQMVNRLLS